jgi:outer membrane receptor protein involved in Fe transport
VRVGAGIGTAGAVLCLAPALLSAQVEIRGRVSEAATGLPVVAALVRLEGLRHATLSDSLGDYRLLAVPPGPRVLEVEVIGYARIRIPVNVPATGIVQRDILLAATPLELPGIVVTADAIARAQGELGTATVIGREAIAHQTASSLAGILELLPGAVVAPPGLESTQQVVLRTAPVGSVATPVALGVGPAELASTGTLIVIDGVPVSNAANLQTTGPRGELGVRGSTAGRGIDLRRIPAATIDRVEVIRGIPSARYGDLTHGVVLVTTRAGAFLPTVTGHLDSRTTEVSAAGGLGIRTVGILSGSVDFASARVAPGLTDDAVLRSTAQLAHRLAPGSAEQLHHDRGLYLDTRLDYYRLHDDSPEQPTLFPGRAAWSRDYGIRVSHRAAYRAARGRALELNLALARDRQRSMVQAPRVRGAMPFTDRLEEGRAIGRYVGGSYISRVEVDGDVWSVYARLEAKARLEGAREHDVRAGAEVKGDWNRGRGYWFDMEFPPQVTFTGVRGFDRPRPFDDIPGLMSTALYVDDLVRGRLLSMPYEVQGGLRADLLHKDGSPSVRDALPQYRVNAQLSPRPWLHVRGGQGLAAKAPSLLQLHPARQYYDVINVNWYAPDPAERLAVLTTFVRDPSNPRLGFATGHKRELSVEVTPGRGGSSLVLAAFQDRTAGGVGTRRIPQFVIRERFELSDSTFGSGAPPEIIEPAARSDTIPILLDRPDHTLDLTSRGIELTMRFPEIAPLRARLEVQGAVTRTELRSEGLDFGLFFTEFQLNERIPRAPYWSDYASSGSRALLTYRLIHQQPAAGVVLSLLLQHILREDVAVQAATDSLAYSGYILRTGELVPVPPAERGLPDYADLRAVRRTGIQDQRARIAPDWIMGLNLSARLPMNGRLSLFAFNALDRDGRREDERYQRRRWPSMRFGLQVYMPFDGISR